MPKKKSTSAHAERRIIVRAVPRAEPDLRRLARALIELAREEIEAEKAAAASNPDGAEEAE